MFVLDSHDAFQAPRDTYIYKLVQVGNGIGVISSDNSLRLIDATNLEAGQANVIKDVHKDVTCLEVMGEEGGSPVVVTAGRDGRVCVIDPRTSQRVGEMKTDRSAPVLSLATSTKGFSIAAGTELQSSQAVVVIWDTRSMNTPRLQYVESHSDDVTELQYHPTHTSILLSGSTDGLVNLYNTTITDEDDALHQTINHGSSIHHAGFLTETDIFALSDDQKFSTCQMVMDFEESVEEPPQLEFGDLREKLDCEYAVNVLARPGNAGVIGIGSHSKDEFKLVQLRNDKPWTFVDESTVKLHEAHGSEIVRTFCFLDQYKTILTGGEDGQIKAWRSA